MNTKTTSWWRRISARVGLGTLAVGFVAGIIFWGGFHWSLEVTNTEEFCISCHEMRENVFKEYRNTIHYSNRTGVRATCPDCHVPREWQYKLPRKIRASNELLHKVLGTIDTPAKFNARRLKMAQHEWERMKGNDSRECRNCHTLLSMDFGEQGRRAIENHERGKREKLTCIECHKGIAHARPPKEQDIGAPKVLSATQ
jgi:cytochrome c-type protein NapC